MQNGRAEKSCSPILLKSSGHLETRLHPRNDIAQPPLELGVHLVEAADQPRVNRIGKNGVEVTLPCDDRFATKASLIFRSVSDCSGVKL